MHVTDVRRWAEENLAKYKHDAQASDTKTHLLALRAGIFSSANRLRHTTSRYCLCWPNINNNITVHSGRVQKDSDGESPMRHLAFEPGATRTIAQFPFEARRALLDFPLERISRISPFLNGPTFL